MSEEVKIVRDEDFYGIWRGQPGAIIGSGIDGLYTPVNHDIEKFQGKKIGCSEACMYYKPLDLVIWVDALNHPENLPFWESLSGHDCLKMSIACDPPSSFNMHGNDVHWLRAQPPNRFSPSFDLGFYPADLTGYLALNVALLLGCNPLWLVGFDSWKHPYNIKARYFKMAEKWLKQHKKTVYVAEEDSFFAHSGLFKYKPLPTGKEEEDKEVTADGLGQ